MVRDRQAKSLDGFPISTDYRVVNAQRPESDVREDRPLVILGGGGHARVVLEAARLAGWNVQGFVDDDRLAPLAAGATWLAKLNYWLMEAHPSECPIVAVGDLALRRRIIDGLRSTAGVVVHPSAVVSPAALLEEGVFVGPGAIINPGARIGAHAIVNSGAIIEHDCAIGANVHVAPGAVLGGDVRVGADALVGLGARVLPGRRIGASATVGAASLVLEDVAAGGVVVGVPARVIQRLPS